MKTHTVSIKATMTMNHSSQTLCLQSNLKACEPEEIVSNDYLESNKLWSQSPTAQDVTTNNEGIILSLYKWRDSYKALRVGDRSFEVHYFGEEGCVEIEDSKLYDAFNTTFPLFKKVRIRRVMWMTMEWCSAVVSILKLLVFSAHIRTLFLLQWAMRL